MKRKLLSVFLFGLLVFGIFAMPASAISARASDQLAQYCSYLVSGDSSGKIGIVFSVSGTDRMKKIGAKEIKIYKQSSNGWTWVKTIDSNVEGMCETNTFFHANTMYYTGISGEYYRVDVTIFAEDAAGSDSRTETHYITAP